MGKGVDMDNNLTLVPVLLVVTVMRKAARANNLVRTWLGGAWWGGA